MPRYYASRFPELRLSVLKVVRGATQTAPLSPAEICRALGAEPTWTLSKNIGQQLRVFARMGLVDNIEDHRGYRRYYVVNGRESELDALISKLDAAATAVSEARTRRAEDTPTFVPVQPSLPARRRRW